jgi:ClpP class serine protease
MPIKSDNIYGQPWAIGKFNLNEIIQVYESYLQDQSIDLTGFDVKFFPGRGKFYEATGESDIIRISEVLVHYRSPFESLIGSTSTLQIIELLSNSVKSGRVKHIFLEFGNGCFGGTLAASQQLAQVIYSYKQIKPIIALVTESCFSGAYWAASACSKIYLACRGVKLGNIGVSSMISKKSIQTDENQYEYLEAGSEKFKTAFSTIPGSKDSEKENQLYKQNFMDIASKIFMEDVARFRGIPLEKIKAMEGRCFFGDYAIENGLADGYYELKEWFLNKKIKEVVNE